jgi:hypothetical protein
MKFLGGLYAVALPTAEYAVLYPGSHIESLWGKIDLPGFDIIEFDITAAHGGKLAGKAQTDDPSKWGTWMWHATTREWEHVSSSAHGTYPCLFTSDGVLALADGAHNGSQGWRYVDEHGRLVTGDDTLNSQRRVGLELGLSDLWEYSHFAGVTIGQGDPPIGCHVLIDGTRRMLEPGGTHFIRVKYAQGVYAISMTKLAENTSVIHRMTRAELLMLPPVTTAPPPQPPPVPEPIPEPLPVQIPDQSQTVAAVRAKYPTPLGATHGPCLLEIAAAIGQGAGLLRKDGGTHIVLPDGTRVAQDIICFPTGHIFDCLGDGEGAATPGWSEAHGSPVETSRYYRVTDAPIHPPTQPPTQPVPDTELAKRVEALERRLQRLETAGLMTAQVFRP